MPLDRPAALRAALGLLLPLLASAGAAAQQANYVYPTRECVRVYSGTEAGDPAVDTLSTDAVLQVVDDPVVGGVSYYAVEPVRDYFNGVTWSSGYVLAADMTSDENGRPAFRARPLPRKRFSLAVTTLPIEVEEVNFDPYGSSGEAYDEVFGEGGFDALTGLVLSGQYGAASRPGVPALGTELDLGAAYGPRSGVVALSASLGPTLGVLLSRGFGLVGAGRVGGAYLLSLEGDAAEGTDLTLSALAGFAQATGGFSFGSVN